MPSQPDYTLAYSLSPQLKPEDSAEQLSRANAEIARLTAALAEATGKSPEEIRKNAEQAALPPQESPIPAPASEQAQEATVVTREEARFFASREGTKYFPIDQIEKTKVKPENLVFFRSEEDALAASYTA